MISQYTRRTRNPWTTPEFLDRPFTSAAPAQPSRWQERRHRALSRILTRLAAIVPDVATGKERAL